MNKRKIIIKYIFEKSQSVYAYIFKRNASWGIKKKELLSYPKDSFGRHLGNFLDINGFNLIDKGERHDAYHTLTGYGTRVEDEIALQWLCFGNGKRSLYVFGAIILGSLFLPEYFKYYSNSYSIGKKANSFHHFDYKKLLKVSIHEFRQIIFSKHQIKKINLTHI